LGRTIVGSSQPDCGIFLVQANSLGGDDAAQGVTAGQYDAAVIDLGRRGGGGLWPGQGCALGQCSAAGWAPVGIVVFSEDCVALGADPIHI
jgi:hypothetical protein